MASIATPRGRARRAARTDDRHIRRVIGQPRGIYDENGRTFSIPVTRSEAGLRDLPNTTSETR